MTNPNRDHKASDVNDAAATRAWETYRLINPTVDGERQTALSSFIEARSAAGDLDVEALAVEGLKFLKRLETGDRRSGG